VSKTPGEASDNVQSNFDQITSIVTSFFQVEESLLDRGIPTYYLKQPQETKTAFIALLKKLEETNFMAVLRRVDNRVILKVFPKPPVRRSSTIINLVLFLATVGTTFAAGYFLSEGLTDPVLGGATFTIAIMGVVGVHEMGHRLAAVRRGVKATFPYFIPGPPPYGTFGAVIVQRDLPANRDALFDIGSSGPIAGFIVATLVMAIGMTMAIPAKPPPEGLHNSTLTINLYNTWIPPAAA